MNGERLTILICEDEPVSRDTLARRLRTRHFDVACVTDGVACLDWLAMHRCDLILMDVDMPRMNGIDCVREIRRAYSHDSLPIIIVSALVDSDDVIAGLQAGANDYVVKPINFPVLQARVLTCLRVRAAVGALIEAERQRVMIETLGQSAARLAEPVGRLIDDLERIAARVARHDARLAGELEDALACVTGVVDVIEKFQAAGRDADVPYANRLDLLVGIAPIADP